MARPTPCRISEETGGYFIGRRYCAKHMVRWDDGGPCPRAELLEERGTRPSRVSWLLIGMSVGGVVQWLLTWLLER